MTTTEPKTATQGIKITDKALEHIRAAMQKEGIALGAGRIAAGSAGRRLLRSVLQHSL